jgi:hypothetical protein
MALELALESKVQTTASPATHDKNIVIGHANEAKVIITMPSEKSNKKKRNFTVPRAAFWQRITFECLPRRQQIQRSIFIKVRAGVRSHAPNPMALTSIVRSHWSEAARILSGGRALPTDRVWG